MNARSALFDVYGDHLSSRGGAAPVAALVRMLAPLDVAAPAVRTAISRMVGQGWLVPVRMGSAPGYRVTGQAASRLRSAADRIYRRDQSDWGRRWHLLVLEPIPERGRRERVRNALVYLGYAPLRDQTWLSPHASSEVEALLAAEGVGATRFSATYDGRDASLAAAAWDVDGIGGAYADWLHQARSLVGSPAARLSDEAAFTFRSTLVHEWRKFLFRDPGLPRELLPADWPGDQAAAFFDSESARLAPEPVDSSTTVSGSPDRLEAR